MRENLIQRLGFYPRFWNLYNFRSVFIVVQILIYFYMLQGFVGVDNLRFVPSKCWLNNAKIVLINSLWNEKYDPENKAGTMQ